MVLPGNEGIIINCFLLGYFNNRNRNYEQFRGDGFIVAYSFRLGSVIVGKVGK